MLESWLIIFIIVTLLMLVISVFMMEEQPMIAIPFIMIGMIFSVLCTYGVWNVEWAVLQSDNTFVIESVSYGEPYSYVFMLLFFIFMLVFIKAGFNTWQQAIEHQSEMEFRKKQRQR